MKLKSETHELDLWRVPLMGFEATKDPRIVWSIFMAIQSGDRDFPPVNVYALDPGRGFHISRNAARRTPHGETAGGGHHRALAHLIADVPLKVNVIKEVHARPYEGSLLLVDIQLVPNDPDYEYRAKHIPQYREGLGYSYNVDFMLDQLARAKNALQNAS